MPLAKFSSPTTEATYTITVSNNSAYPLVKATFHGATSEQVRTAISLAREAFCAIEVMSEQTDEVCYTLYANEEFFSRTDTCGRVIDRISKLLYS